LRTLGWPIVTRSKADPGIGIEQRHLMFAGLFDPVQSISNRIREGG